MRVRVEGPDSSTKPALVFIHGAGGSATIWLDLFRHFERSRRVVALDLPGHGQSEPFHDVSDSNRIQKYADAVLFACAELKIDRAVLVGHSMGGLVALAAAAASPASVVGLVLLASAPGLKPSKDMLAALAEKREQHASLMEPLMWSAATARDTIERWSKTTMSADPDVTIADFRACAAFDAATVLQPTLLIGGQDDPLCSPRFMAKGAARLPAGELQVVSDASHFMFLERPDISIAAIERFLSFV
ncbi:MAG: alpha/beta hydrolase [Polyangia bacterium]